MKQRLFVVGVILGLAILYFGYQWQTRKVHYHAGFIVYVNGKREDFAKPQFMKLERCGDERDENEQLEKAHLHDNVGEVVHVHRKGAKWGDLFKNIGYSFPMGELTAYVNGQKVNNILKYPIKAYDSAVILFGKSNQVDVSDKVSTERIKQVENAPESCGK